MSTVYLCGAMEGLTQEEAEGWRKLAHHSLQFSTKVLDPCRRKKFHDQEFSNNLANRLVAMDLQDIDNSDLVLANLKDRGTGKAWGSVMEICYAYTKGIPVITVLEEGFNHPFISSMSTEVHSSLEEALKVVKGYFE